MKVNLFSTRATPSRRDRTSVGQEAVRLVDGRWGDVPGRSLVESRSFLASITMTK
jgi:hypothetical protein